MRTRTFLLVLFFAAALSFSTPAAELKRVLLIGQGPDGHPPGTHEFMAGCRVVEALLKPWAGEIKTTIAKADEPWPEGPKILDEADGIVLLVTQGARWMQTDVARFNALKRLAERKGGIVALHWSVGAKDAEYIPGQLALLGGTRGGPQRKYKILETDVRAERPMHPILSGLGNFRIRDEFYYRLDLAEPGPTFHPLLSAKIDGKDEVASWAWERPEGGRSFGFVGLHFHENWKREEIRRLVTQAILWTNHLPIPEEGVKVDIDPAVIELPKK